MLQLILCVLPHFFVMAFSQAGLLTQGDGVWSTIDVDQCDTEIEEVIVSLEAEKHRLNRTHDVLRVNVDFAKPIDNTYGVFIVLCKHMDGGCKHYTNIVDNLENLLNKHARSNYEHACELAGVDPSFPLPEGHHLIDNFVMDYCELPTNSAYGKYEAEVFFVKDEQYVGCFKIIIEFEQDGICI